MANTADKHTVSANNVLTLPAASSAMIHARVCRGGGTFVCYGWLAGFEGGTKDRGFVCVRGVQVFAYGLGRLVKGRNLDFEKFAH